MSTPALELQGVSKSFGAGARRAEVLANINLRVENGEFVAVVGYSGAGKTTLISVMAGLVRPDSGTITLNDLEITGPGPDRGIVFQNYSLLLLHWPLFVLRPIFAYPYATIQQIFSMRYTIMLLSLPVYPSVA